MFSNTDLVEYLKTSNDININSVITAEWNMNVPGNIKKIGNYRYRPNDNASIYKNIPNLLQNKKIKTNISKKFKEIDLKRILNKYQILKSQ